MTYQPERTAEAAGIHFWTHVHEAIQEHKETSSKKPRLASINIQLAGSQAPAIGFLNSAGVSFNCRIVAYQMWCMTPGSMIVDITRSTPVTHPEAWATVPPYRFPSLIGAASGLPIVPDDSGGDDGGDDGGDGGDDGGDGGDDGGDEGEPSMGLMGAFMMIMMMFIAMVSSMFGAMDDPPPDDVPVSGSIYPSINGAYSDGFHTEVWASRELMAGDMVHVYCLATDGTMRNATMMLYLQDLDEKV